jgi:hypothetical protein
MTRPVKDARLYACSACARPGGFYGAPQVCWPCWIEQSGLRPVPAREPAKRSSPAARLRLIEVLTDALGAPLADPSRGLLRWPCPCCLGGMSDTSELPYRPLCVDEAGQVWCDASLRRGYGPPTCALTPKRLAEALRRLRETAA